MDLDIQAKSLLDLLDQFPDERSCAEYIALLRWPCGKVCPSCGGKRIHWRNVDVRLTCSDCHHNFSVRTGTIFQGSKIPLRTWFAAIWLILNHPKGISSVQLGKELGVRQATAWSMLKRLREAADAMREDTPLEGQVEADETYVGGKEHNKHYDKKASTLGVSHADLKTPVVGVRERSGDVRLSAMPLVTAGRLGRFIRDRVKKGSDLYTDELPAYGPVGKQYNHETVNHKRKEYVRGDVHTNSIESVWAIIKRAHKGTYHWWSKKYMHLYLAEFEVRFNMRGRTMGQRVSDMLMGCCL